MTISVLARNGQSGRAIARMLGVTENTVRYHLQRQASGAVDGRSEQEHKADRCAEAIAHYIEGVGQGPVNLAALHALSTGTQISPGTGIENSPPGVIN